MRTDSEKGRMKVRPGDGSGGSRSVAAWQSPPGGGARPATDGRVALRLWHETLREAQAQNTTNLRGRRNREVNLRIDYGDAGGEQPGAAMHFSCTSR